MTTGVKKEMIIVCIHDHAPVHLQTRVRACACAYACAYYVHVHACVYVSANACAYAPWVCACARACACACADLYVYVCGEARRGERRRREGTEGEERRGAERREGESGNRVPGEPLKELVDGLGERAGAVSPLCGVERRAIFTEREQLLDVNFLPVRSLLLLSAKLGSVHRLAPALLLTRTRASNPRP